MNRRPRRLLVICNGPLRPAVMELLDELAEEAVEDFLARHPELPPDDEAGNPLEVRETLRDSPRPRLRRVK